MGSQKQGLGQDVLWLLQEQRVDAQDQESNRGEQVRWELLVGLVFHHVPHKPMRAKGRFFSKYCEWSDNIGIEIELVGMPMMSVMLIDPPTPTPTNQQIDLIDQFLTFTLPV